MGTNWFSAICESARKLAIDEGDDYIYTRIPPEYDEENPSKEIQKDKEYITIRIKSSRIGKVRRWNNKFYASVHSHIQYLHEDKGNVDIQLVQAPDKLRDIDHNHPDRLVQMDKIICGPIPFIGDFNIKLGLFSVKGSDLTAPYLDFLTALAEKAGGSSIGPILEYVSPLQKGMELLFGNSAQSELEVGIDRSLSKVTTGTWILMRRPKSKFESEKLRISDSDGSVICADGTPLKGHPYIVFSIEASERRDDWMNLPELKSAWDQLRSAVLVGNIEKAEQMIKNFEIVTRWSPDLIPADATRLLNSAKSKYYLAQEGRGMSASPTSVIFPNFAELDIYGIEKNTPGEIAK